MNQVDLVAVQQLKIIIEISFFCLKQHFPQLNPNLIIVSKVSHTKMVSLYNLIRT